MITTHYTMEHSSITRKKVENLTWTFLSFMTQLNPIFPTQMTFLQFWPYCAKQIRLIVRQNMSPIHYPLDMDLTLLATGEDNFCPWISKDPKYFFNSNHFNDLFCLFVWNPTIFNIIRWVAGSIVSLTKRLMVQVLFW